VFVASLPASYHVSHIFDVVDARRGKNWRVVVPSSLTWFATLQVAPPLSEKRTKILVSLVAVLVRSVYETTIRPVVRFTSIVLTENTPRSGRGGILLVAAAKSVIWMAVTVTSAPFASVVPFSVS